MTELILSSDLIQSDDCIKRIVDGLQSLGGIEIVQIEAETGQISIQGNGIKLPIIADKLSSLGYPVA